MATNRFHDYLRDFLCRQNTWRLISEASSSDVKAINAPQHLTWLKDHQDQHPYREIMLVFDGCGCASLNGQVYPYQTGDVFVFDPFDCHDSYYPATTESGLHLWIRMAHHMITGGMVTISRGQTESLPQTSFALDNASLTAVVGSALTNARNSSETEAIRHREVSATLALLLAFILENDRCEGKTASGSNRQAKIIHSIQEHIDQTGGEGLNLDNLAKLAGYSKYHFARLFKAHLGRRKNVAGGCASGIRH